MNSGASAHVRALLLCLIRRAKGMKVQDIHHLLFAIGGGLGDQPSAFLGCTFIRDVSGPFSPELKDLLIALRQEGLVVEKGEGPEATVEITPVGRVFESHYTRLLPGLEEAVDHIVSIEGELLSRASRGLENFRYGEVVVIRSSPSEQETSGRQPVVC